MAFRLCGAWVLILILAIRTNGESTESKESTPDKPETDKQIEATPTVKLDPYVVDKRPPKLCFGVSLAVWRSNTTGKVVAIYIKRVKPGSDADKAGFGPGTRIYQIEGKPVEEMSASFEDGNDLNRIFINRKLGARITVEAQPKGSTTRKTAVLMERVYENARYRWFD